MVECHLAKVEVAGPNPVSRSKKNDKHKTCLSFFLERAKPAVVQLLNI